MSDGNKKGDVEMIDTSSKAATEVKKTDEKKEEPYDPFFGKPSPSYKSI